MRNGGEVNGRGRGGKWRERDGGGRIRIRRLSLLHEAEA